MKYIKYILFGLLGIVFVLFLGFVGLVGYATLSDYKPAPTTLVFENKDAISISSAKTYKLLIWNIGYAGLSEDMDFFYDGGKQVRPSRQTVEANVAAIENFIAQQKDIDFFLLQEVDQRAKRSYYIDEYAKIAALLPQFYSSFGKNYDVFYVPVPLGNPMGRVVAGLQSLSRFGPLSVVRYSFPGSFSWPTGLFMLDRCFLVQRYKLDTGKELLIINTHNSAYDDGSLRSQEMTYFKNFLIQEYKKGNYVIVGGDWNQSPPSFTPKFKFNLMDNEDRMDIEKNYLPGWKWAFDPTIPSNRRVVAPYDQKTTLTTVIDFFLLSPNIKLIQVKGMHLNFKNSDHNPVKLEIKLKN